MRELFDVTDRNAVEPLISRIVRAAGGELAESPELEHVRHRTHKPHRNASDWLSASWRYRRKDDPNAPCGFVLLRARRDGSSRSEYHLARRSHDTTSGIVHLPDLDATAWVFPFDPALPGLAELADPIAAAETLRTIGVPISDPSPDDLTVGVVHYYPEQRCTFRYSWTGTDRSERTVYLKASRDSTQTQSQIEGCTAFRDARCAPAFAVPVPLGADVDRGLIAFAAFDHTPLVDHLHGADAESIIAGCGARLASFHRTRVPAPRVIAVGDQLDEIDQKLDKLELARFSAEHVGRVRRLLRRDLPEISSRTTTHGDFHLRQVGVGTHGDLVLFDFDELTVADPARDIAGLLVSLETDPDVTDPGRLAVAFLRGYESVAPLPRSLPWQIRVQLATKAYRGHRAPRPGATAVARRLLELAAADQLPPHLSPLASRPIQRREQP